MYLCRKRYIDDKKSQIKEIKEICEIIQSSKCGTFYIAIILSIVYLASLTIIRCIVYHLLQYDYKKIAKIVFEYIPPQCELHPTQEFSNFQLGPYKIFSPSPNTDCALII